MNGRRQFTIWLMVLVSSFFASTVAFAANTWTDQDSGTDSSLSSIVASDSLNAWAVGEAGTILRTTDGGKHWMPQVSGTAVWLGSMVRTDGNVLWATGGGGTLIKSVDDGAKWTPVPLDTTASLSRLTFTDPAHAWVIAASYSESSWSTATVFATNDGGQHWLPQESLSAEYLSGLSFADNLHGCATGTRRNPQTLNQESGVFVTSDGGLHWDFNALPEYGLQNVSLVSASTGWAVGYLRRSGYPDVILKTTDGGTNWTRAWTGTELELRSVKFVSATHGWAVGGSPKGIGDVILETTDGGQHWSRKTLANRGDGILGVSFADDSHGWGVGYFGNILHYAPVQLIAPTLSSVVAPSAVQRSRSFTAYGYLKPHHTAGTFPVRVYKYRWVNGAWKAYGYVSAKASNYSTYTKYACSLSLPYAGKWRLRSYAPADSRHSAKWSTGYDYVTVK